MQGATTFSCANAACMFTYTLQISPGSSVLSSIIMVLRTAFLYLPFYTACRQSPYWCSYLEISPRSDTVLTDKYSLSEVKGIEGFSVN